MRLLIDANLSPRVAARLAAVGHDVVHVFDIGLGSASDAAILAHASSNERVVVSSDIDFGALLARHDRSTRVHSLDAVATHAPVSAIGRRGPAK